MKKILAFILIVLIILLLIILFLKKGQEPKNLPSVTPTVLVPTNTPFISPPGNKIQLNGVSVNNFYLEDSAENPQGDVSVVKNKNYQIVYIPQFKKFIISILNKDFEAARGIAEQNFLSQLGITQADACKLKVEISTPLFVNEKLSGQIFPLSFCR